jgi:hypothetical protein
VSSGLTAPTGLTETPDGALWVTDDVKGLCRVDTSRAPAGIVD